MQCPKCQFENPAGEMEKSSSHIDTTQPNAGRIYDFLLGGKGFWGVIFISRWEKWSVIV